MIVHIKEILKKSEKGGYVVGSFNVHNFETIVGVVSAAQKMRSPLIIQVSEGAIKYIGLGVFVAAVKEISAAIAPKIPIALHIDHGKSVESVMACVKAGFSSIHIDGSHLPLKENIRLTKKVVGMAHKKGVWVQGEVGAMVGGHGDLGGVLAEIPLADVSEVVRFVRETGVDTIAAAVGTAHGVYDNEDIKIKMVEEIKKQTKIPFILHGGSGLPVAKIRKAVKAGVNVVNIGSDIKIAFSQTLIKACVANQKETDPRKLLSPTMAAVEEVVSKHMRIFGSAGRIV